MSSDFFFSALTGAALAHSGRDAQPGQQPPLDEKPHRDHDYQRSADRSFFFSLDLSFFSGRSRPRPSRLSGKVPVDERRKFVLCRKADEGFPDFAFPDEKQRRYASDPIIRSGFRVDSSTFTLITFTRPSYSLPISSRTGARALQGPHQGAQKSTSAGLSVFNTADSKVLSSACPTHSFVSIFSSIRIRCIYLVIPLFAYSHHPDYDYTITPVRGVVIDPNQRREFFHRVRGC